MDTVRFLWDEIRSVLNFPIVNLGKIPVTLWLLIYLLVLFVLLFYVTARLRRWFAEGLLARRGIDIGVRQAVGSILRYVTLFLGFVIILQTAGIDLSALAILTGAIGIGIGFGLQNIINNFVSGLIILFERPIKVGDRIEIGEIQGDVLKISARSTTIMTNDNIAVIVPNSDFVTSKVINWSFPNPNVRFNFPVSVAYESDPDQVREVLLRVAEDHPGVLKDPGSDVLFKEFGETLNFVLRVWTREYTQRPNVLRSELNYEIINKFKEHGIGIPSPQKEVRILNDLEPEEIRRPHLNRPQRDYGDS
jgi:small-conductance mechanosensitive channel